MKKKNSDKSKKEMLSLIEKIRYLERENELDLSKEEDLSIAIMNLVSLEEHLYFSGMKTSRKKYFHTMDEVRKMRVELMREFVRNTEAETWCITKHLLAASMRLIEVGNKHFSKNEEKKAFFCYRVAFQLYSLVWGFNLDLIEGNEKNIEKKGGKKHPSRLIEPDSSGLEDSRIRKITELVKRVVDCCKE